MSNVNIIHIEIRGKVSTGKSAVLSSIRDMLEQRGFCVATPDRAERLNPSQTLDNADSVDTPSHNTVFVLTEKFTPSGI